MQDTTSGLVTLPIQYADQLSSEHLLPLTFYLDPATDRYPTFFAKLDRITPVLLHIDTPQSPSFSGKS